MKFIATTGFNMEGALSRELKQLGYNADIQTSRAIIEGGLEDGAYLNLMLRTAGSVRLIVGEFKAKSYDELYEGVSRINWADYIERGVSLKVNARAVNGVLYSPRDIQSVAHKAICERLMESYKVRRISGAIKYEVYLHIHRAAVTVSINTSGKPLHMRGYRVLNPEAALRETLAAALVIYSGWRHDWKLYDPMCGSGTLCVEAAMIARNMAPGIDRSFSAESFPWWDKKIWQNARQRCKDEALPEKTAEIIGSDIDKRVLSMANTHARKAGVQNDIKFFHKDVRTLKITDEHGHIISNPPYGVRLGSDKNMPIFYKSFFKALPKNWSWHILSALDDVENLAGRRADKKRRLYNGRLECQYFEFFRKKS